MFVHLIRNKASKQEMEEMLRALENYIKVAVDIEKGILAGGGIMHADCEAILLDEGSRQENIWGANFDPATGETQFEALINIRPRLGNRKMQVENPEIRAKIKSIIDNLLKT